MLQPCQLDFYFKKLSHYTAEYLLAACSIVPTWCRYYTICFYCHLSVTELALALSPPPILALPHLLPLLAPLQQLSILDYELLYLKPAGH